MLNLKPTIINEEKNNTSFTQSSINSGSPVRIWVHTLIEYDMHGHPSIVKSFGIPEGKVKKKKKEAETFVKAAKSQEEVEL